MVAWHIPRWALPAALCGVAGITSADLVLMRRHPVLARPRAIPEQIGLHADADGEGLRVQWDRGSRPIRNADHATLYIEDGTLRNQLDLTGRQLDSASVMYWPESERVTFRLEAYRGSQSSSDSVEVAPVPARSGRRQARPVRAMVEARPSPFERVAPEIVVTQTLPPPVVPPMAPVPVAVAEAPRESRLGRMISRIPLLRRFQKHPPSDETAPRP